MESGPSAAYYRRFADVASGPVHAPSPPASPLLTAATDPQEFMDDHDANALYAILNLERSASEQDIKDQYRALATTYHPDKQGSDDARLAAHQRFTAIQRAYDVLSDHTRREIYDMYGEDGLRRNWQLGPKGLSKEQLRARLMKENVAMRKLELASLVESKGEMSITLDARAVFVPPERFKNPEALSHTPLARISRVRPGQVMLKHSYETPITKDTQFIIEGTMAAKGGAGGANISGTIKHQFSPKCWAQYTQTALFPYIGSVKASYVFDQYTFLNVNAIVQTFAAPPRMTFSLGRRLYQETTGFITFKTGFFALGPWGSGMPEQMLMADQSALSIGATTARPNGSGWTLELQTGVLENAITTDWSTNVAGLRLSFGTSVFFGGANLFASARTSITQFTRAGMELSVNLGGAVTLKMFINRLGQRLTLPIILTHDNNPYVLLATAVLPAAGYAAAYRYWILPRKHKRINTRIHELQREHAEYSAQKRAEQQDALLSMQRPVQDRVVLERRRNGLIILDAKYGRADAFTPRGVHDVLGWDGLPAVIDVTVPLQMLVQDSRLYIPAGRAKHGLNGFYDPCIGENKKIRVRYEFRGKVHEVTVDDVSSLRAPVKAHALDE